MLPRYDAGDEAPENISKCNRIGGRSTVPVIQPLGFGLKESAAEWIVKTRYEPAKLNGYPVDVYAQMAVNFHLY